MLHPVNLKYKFEVQLFLHFVMLKNGPVDTITQSTKTFVDENLEFYFGHPYEALQKQRFSRIKIDLTPLCRSSLSFQYATSDFFPLTEHVKMSCSL